LKFLEELSPVQKSTATFPSPGEGIFLVDELTFQRREVLPGSQ
jgi:hypothetical protein